MFQKDIKTYQNGLYWHCNDLTLSLNEQIDKRININMASVIIIDGGQGQGKTTLAVHIADYINKKRGLPPIDLSIKNHNQIGMGGVDFISKFNKCEKNNLPVLIYDEAGDYSKASTMTYFNYQLSKIFQKIRSAKIIILICLPNYNILDNRLFDDEIIRGAIHCYGRQVTVNYGNLKLYDLEMLSWVRYWYTKLPMAIRRKCYEKVSPMLQSYFKDLPKTRARQLEILSTAGKQKERLASEVKMKGLVTTKEISEEIGRSLVWVRLKIGESNIEYDSKIGSQNYYNKSVIHRLEKLMKMKK